MTPILGTGPEILLFTTGGSAIAGYLAGKALRMIVKIVAIIVGVFILVLAYLSYKGWLTTNWNVVETQTKQMAYNASAQILQMVSHTASQFTTHPSLISAEATPIAAGVGFSTGFVIGLRR